MSGKRKATNDLLAPSKRFKIEKQKDKKTNQEEKLDNLKITKNKKDNQKKQEEKFDSLDRTENEKKEKKRKQEENLDSFDRTENEKKEKKQKQEENLDSVNSTKNEKKDKKRKQEEKLDSLDITENEKKDKKRKQEDEKLDSLDNTENEKKDKKRKQEGEKLDSLDNTENEKKDKKRKKEYEKLDSFDSTINKNTFVNCPVSLFACGKYFLGLGPVITRVRFAKPISTLGSINLCDIQTAYFQTVLVRVNPKNETEVLDWGCNDSSAAHVLGRDGEESEPHQVPALIGKDIIQVSVGQYHMAALTSSGEVYFWGNFKDDDFIGPNTKQDHKGAIKYPELHPDLIGIKIKHIASGGNFTTAISENGELLEWGCTWRTENDNITRNTAPRLCQGPSTLIISNGKPQTVVCGHAHGIVRVAEATGGYYFASWGSNRHGQLGHGDTLTIEQPEKIKGLPENVEMIACGGFHNIALTEDHKVFVWGRNSYGQLGNGDDNDVDTPQQNNFFNNLENEHVVHVSCGYSHSFALTNKGHVYAWGFGDELQLGNGVEDLVKAPTLIKIPATHQCLKIVAGSSTSFFICKEVNKNIN